MAKIDNASFSNFGITGRLQIAKTAQDVLLWIVTFSVVTLTVFLLLHHGGVWWRPGDYVSLWSSEVWSSHNSQHPFDPYTLTHMLHGVLCFWTINIFTKKLPLSRQFFLAILFACSWELLENSAFVIERYRIVTASADYMGDAVINSLSDILSCGFGFLIARQIKYSHSVVIFLVIELAMAFWVRDNLTLNVLMLVYPLETIRLWQMNL